MALDLQGKSVFVTRAIPESGIALLESVGITVQVHRRSRPLHSMELGQEVGRHDGVICQLTDRIDASILSSAAPRCKVFATCAAGYDNIDIAAASRLGIAITHTPDVLTEATADLTWGLILMTARRLGEAERVVRGGDWRGWGMLDFLGMELHGKTLGIVGAGRIAAAVARRAGGFSMRVLYTARRQRERMKALGATHVALPELLAACDVVSLHVPLTEETRHMIDAKALGRMKREAILINTARGSVVDQEALIEVLRRGGIAGAGLDVYENEPTVPEELMGMDNVVLLPHIGSATVETRSRMARIAAENVVSILRGQGALNPVPAC